MTEPDEVDLVGVGLNATDTVVPLTRFPEPGSKVEYRGGSVLPGGQVATAVVACQSWGMRTRYIGKLGDDGAAALHREAFARAGVETRLMTVPGAVSAQSLILLDELGERTVLCRKDEQMRLRPEELERSWIVRARALLVDGYDTEAARVAAQWAREADVPVVADLDEMYPGVEGLLEQIDFLIMSRDLPCRLMGQSDLGRALRGLQSRYGCRLAAATLGEDGVMSWDGRTMRRASAFRVPVVDTTGAGDIFHAGFLFGLLRGWDLERRMDFACAAAALNCTKVGARGGIATVEEIEAVMCAGERYGMEDRADLAERVR